MSTILKVTVNSQPATIEIEWQGDIRLTRRHVHIDRARVFVEGRTETLEGWDFDRGPSPGGHKTYTLALARAQGGAGYQPRPEEVIALELHVGDPPERLIAGAVVDGEDCECEKLVADAINSSGEQIESEIQSVSQAVQDVNQGVQTAGAGVQQSYNDFKAGYDKAMKLLTGFPFQVSDGLAGGPSTAGAAVSASAVIDRQLRAVLGRVPGIGGVAATVSALDRSFQAVIVDGAQAWTWRPQSYAVQSDIGAGVTGRQASLATFAGTVVDEILPLIAGLRPLVPENAVNPDEIDAARAILTGSLPAFVTEVGTDGGPRIARARGLLTDTATQLEVLGMLLGALGQPPPGTDLSNPLNWPAPPGGPAGYQFVPLDPSTWWPPSEDYVVTVDDEQNLTNYRIGFDRAGVLVTQFATVYAGGQTGDRGMLIVILQRALDASGEAAQAVFDALDSVNLGEDERRVIVADAATGLTVEDAVSWAAMFPTDEAAPLLQDGGKLGARSVLSRTQAISAAITAVQGLANPPGLQHPRVVFALQLLQDAFTDVVTAARPLT